MKKPFFVRRKFMNFPTPAIFTLFHLAMISLAYAGEVSSTGLLSPRVIKLLAPSPSFTLTILWVFFTLLPSITVQKVITSPSLRLLRSSISLQIMRSFLLNVGFIESDSTVIGMNPKRFATPLFLPDEKTMIVISSANISTIHAITFAPILSTFFIVIYSFIAEY